MSAVIKQFINDFNRLLKSDKSTLKSYFCHVWNLRQKPEPLLASVVYQMGVTKSHAVLLKIVCKASSSTVSNTLATVKQKKRFSPGYTCIRKSVSQSVQPLSRVRLFATPWTCSTPALPVHHHLPQLTSLYHHLPDMS